MRYHNITKDDMLNGDGLRVVLWVSGCNHCCEGCQNPITWDPDGGLLFDEAAKEEIFAELSHDYTAGITFSGGDPMHSANRLDVKNLMLEIRDRFPDKTIWMYTGYSWEEILDSPIVELCDVIVDGEFEKDKFDSKLLWKGSKNQRVIDVKKTLVSENREVPILHCGDYN
ncbi:MAG: anaerobic ribonucleoside-triphosphate reductase activating protein [Lachnospiraceae bacterium]|nr:anaerobic ribonucleoside-triphosphate reductase activating protein [Lachnospiraceae bacterium]